jgi:hypothetical protein
MQMMIMRDEMKTLALHGVLKYTGPGLTDCLGNLGIFKSYFLYHPRQNAGTWQRSVCENTVDRRKP